MTLVLAVLLHASVLTEPELRAFTHPARHVRIEAIRAVAQGPAATADLLAYLEHDDSRVARAVIGVCLLRKAEDALEGLARCADHPDGARAEAAARAALAISSDSLGDLESLHFAGMRRLPARLQRAVDEDVADTLPRIRGYGHADRTQEYRRYFAGGAYAARALDRVARDGREPESVREHALQALALLLGPAGIEPIGTALLDDPAPRVRITCASLLAQFGSRKSHELLARRLDSPRILLEYEQAWVVKAVERTGILSDAGERKLVRLVTEGLVNRALGAAAALKKTRPKVFAAALRKRIERYLTADRKHPGAGLGAALFEFRVGPLPPDLREAMRASESPLLKASAMDRAADALPVIEPMIAPEKALGSREPLRVRIVYHLLRRLGAPGSVRARFAASALVADHAPSRRYGVWALEKTPEADLRPLLPRLRVLLEDRFESVRLGAAELLGSEPAAVEAAIVALYDGDRRSARIARRILAAARPEWPEADVSATVAERRKLARRLRELHKTAERDKE